MTPTTRLKSDAATLKVGSTTSPLALHDELRVRLQRLRDPSEPGTRNRQQRHQRNRSLHLQSPQRARNSHHQPRRRQPAGLDQRLLHLRRPRHPRPIDRATAIGGANPTTTLTQYFIDGQNPSGLSGILEQHVNNLPSPAVSYVIGLCALSQVTSSWPTFLLPDALGSTRLLANSSGLILRGLLTTASATSLPRLAS